jgi:hypothetical protein
VTQFHSQIVIATTSKKGAHHKHTHEVQLPRSDRRILSLLPPETPGTTPGGYRPQAGLLHLAVQPVPLSVDARIHKDRSSRPRFPHLSKVRTETQTIPVAPLVRKESNMKTLKLRIEPRAGQSDKARPAQRETVKTHRN